MSRVYIQLTNDKGQMTKIISRDGKCRECKPFH